MKEIRANDVPAIQSGSESASAPAKGRPPLAAQVPSEPSEGPSRPVPERSVMEQGRSRGAVWKVQDHMRDERRPMTGQSGERIDGPAINPEHLAALLASAKPAEDVRNFGDARITKELAATGRSSAAVDASGVEATGQETMDRLVGAFVAEPDAEARQDLLALAAEVSTTSPASLRSLLSLALQTQQPLDVQKQALYLAADHEPSLVQKVAANTAHPLHLEAEAFLLENQVRDKVQIPDRTEAAALTPPAAAP